MTMSNVEAQFEAQKIAFAPFYFQAAMALKELGLLDAIATSRSGVSIATIKQHTGVSLYGVKVLVEAGISAGLLSHKKDEDGVLSIAITKVGRFIRSDQMTEVNLNFAQDVCYAGLAHLKDSITQGKPVGLSVFGEWDTVYQGLAHLPEHVRNSWFAFDHYYSDHAFSDAIPLVFGKDRPKRILDIGGNTGKWARLCCTYDAQVEVTIVDLPGQLENAKERIEKTPYGDRVHYIHRDLLDATQPLPHGHDVVWMSQFLDCFGSDEIISILTRVSDAITEKTFVYILEPFWDNQKFEAGRFSLVGTSLYFTCIANGNSKMYGLNEMKTFSSDTGFEVVETFELIGNSFHTLLKLRKRAKPTTFPTNA